MSDIKFARGCDAKRWRALSREADDVLAVRGGPSWDKALRERLFPGRVAPSGILDYFRYSWVADGTKAAAKLGFTATRSSSDLFAEVDKTT